jgi:hypothetical protein
MGLCLSELDIDNEPRIEICAFNFALFRYMPEVRLLLRTIIASNHDESAPEIFNQTEKKGSRSDANEPRKYTSCTGEVREIFAGRNSEIDSPGWTGGKKDEVEGERGVCGAREEAAGEGYVSPECEYEESSYEVTVVGGGEWEGRGDFHF